MMSHLQLLSIWVLAPAALLVAAAVPAGGAANATVDLSGEWYLRIDIQTGPYAGAVVPCQGHLSHTDPTISGTVDCGAYGPAWIDGTVDLAAGTLDIEMDFLGTTFFVQATISADATTMTGSWVTSEGYIGEYYALRTYLYFSNLTTETMVNTPCGLEGVTLTSSWPPAWLITSFSSANDMDGDGLDESPVLVWSFNLTGDSPCFGPITERLRSDLVHPFAFSQGRAEETVNNIPGVLEFPPLDVTLGLYFEIEVDQTGEIAHNDQPLVLEGRTNQVPPGPADMLRSPTGPPLPLVDEQENPTGVEVLSVWTQLNPGAVGGTTELPVEGAVSPASPADSPAASSGPSAAGIAAIAGGAAAAAVALAAGSWYARRRWLR